MTENYTLREPVDRTTLLQAMEVAAKELKLIFTTYRPIGEPSHSRIKGVIIEKRFESSGWRRLASMLYPNTQFSYTTFLLFEQISHLDFLLFDGNPIKIGVGGVKSPDIGTEHHNYTTAKSSLDGYMAQVYGKMKLSRFHFIPSVVSCSVS